MSTPSFELKLRHAEEHAKALDRAVGRWVKRHPDLIISEVHQDAEMWRREWRFRPGIETVPRWSLVVGDAVHNLRSALDHLAYALALRFTPNMTADQIGMVEFPIFGTRPPEARDIKRKIGCVDPNAQAIILGLQPHLSSAYGKHPLWVLHDLDNIDKHRLVNALLVEAGGIEVYGMVDLSHAALIVNGGSSSDPDAPIVALESDEPLDPNVDVGFEPTIEIAFSEGPAKGRVVRQLVADLRTYIAKSVLPPLTPYL